MVNNKKVLLILTVSSILIVLGIFYLSEAHELWTTYQNLSNIRSIPYDAYEAWIKYMEKYMEKYHRLFPLYLTKGLVLFVSGVTASFWAVRNWVLHRERRSSQAKAKS